MLGFAYDTAVRRFVDLRYVIGLHFHYVIQGATETGIHGLIGHGRLMWKVIRGESQLSPYVPPGLIRSQMSGFWYHQHQGHQELSKKYGTKNLTTAFHSGHSTMKGKCTLNILL